MINKLINLANTLDEFGAIEEADEVDELIEEHSEEDLYEVGQEELPQDIKPKEEIESDFDENWSLYRGALTNPEGVRYDVRQIRKGTFSKVYEFSNNKEEILVST